MARGEGAAPWCGPERFVLELAPGQKPTRDTRIRDGREVAVSMASPGAAEEDDEDAADEEDYWDDEGFSEDASVRPVRLWRVALREIMERGRVVGQGGGADEEPEGPADELADDSASEHSRDADTGWDAAVTKPVLLQRPELRSPDTGLRFLLRRIEQRQLERFDERLFDTFLVQDFDTCAAESLTAACNAISGSREYTPALICDAFGKAAVRKLGGKSASDPALSTRPTDDKNTKRLKRMVRQYKKGGHWEATWDVGNSDIEDAAASYLGLKAVRLLGRNWMPAPPPKGSSEEAAKKEEVWAMLRDNFAGGRKWNSGVLLFHLQGYDSGHYALIFGLREVRLVPAAREELQDGGGQPKKTKKSKADIRRDVFTPTYGQKPKHWVSLDRVYNMLFHSKFTGYAVIKLEPK